MTSLSFFVIIKENKEELKIRPREKLEGRTFDYFEVIEYLPQLSKERRSPYYKCICLSCGKEIIVRGTLIKTGKQKVAGVQEKNNLIGQTFQHLQVLDWDKEKMQMAQEKYHRYIPYYKCKCSCGKECTVNGWALAQKTTSSCGHLQKEKRYEDLTDKVFGKLTVIKLDEDKTTEKSLQYNRNTYFWKCQCSCGNKITVSGDHLRSGHTTSCGCIKSKGERLIAEILKNNSFNFVQQYSFPDLKGQNNGLLKFDFMVADKNNEIKCLIEYQGEQHYPGNRGYTKEGHERDLMKISYCQKHNIPLIIIKYTDYDKLKSNYKEFLYELF